MTAQLRLLSGSCTALLRSALHHPVRRRPLVVPASGFRPSFPCLSGSLYVGARTITPRPVGRSGGAMRLHRSGVTRWRFPSQRVGLTAPPPDPPGTGAGPGVKRCQRRCQWPRAGCANRGFGVQVARAVAWKTVLAPAFHILGRWGATSGGGWTSSWRAWMQGLFGFRTSLKARDPLFRMLGWLRSAGACWLRARQHSPCHKRTIKTLRR